ncbi:hypothetical protein BKA70DRAFT_468219 [Coprinopsis sp. MPI-PUGE-AT-0042]|nr:hypothetical protein BKA70DRAFT_468219 [Coprinopsis sp. MPI-PUGE-AT-0042]
MTEFTRWVVIDDNDSRIGYSGSWSRSNGDKYNNQGNFGPTFDNSLHTTTPASSLSFSFTGNAAKIYATTDLSITDGISDPDWDCILDDNVVGDAKTKPFQYVENNWEFCNFVNLSPSQHTISLSVKTKGRPFLFDRIHYRPTNPVENERILATRDDADITYNEQGKWGALAQNGYMTHERGAEVSFPFIGTRVELRAMAPTERPRGASEATYSIDNGDEIPFTIRQVGSISDYNRKIFETGELSQGRHVLKVTYRGGGNVTPLVVDGFIVSGGTNRRAPEPVEAPSPAPATPNTPNSPDPGSNSPGNDGGNTNGGGASTTGGGTTGPSRSSTVAPTSVADVRPEDAVSRVVYIKTSDGAAPEATPGSGADLSNATNDADGVGATSKGGNNTGAIIGGIIGAVAILIIAIGLFTWMRRRRSRQRRISSFAATGFNPSYGGEGFGHYQQQHAAPPMSYSSSAPNRWSGSAPVPEYAPSSTHGRTLSDSRSDVPSSTAAATAPPHGTGQPFGFPDTAPPVYRH